MFLFAVDWRSRNWKWNSSNGDCPRNFLRHFGSSRSPRGRRKMDLQSVAIEKKLRCLFVWYFNFLFFLFSFFFFDFQNKKKNFWISNCLGINDDTSFEEDINMVSNYRCKIYGFDNLTTSALYYRMLPNGKFQPWEIVAKKTDKVKIKIKSKIKK